LAKQLAKSLGYIYIDSGAMYRAITLYFLRNHIDWSETQMVQSALKNIHISFIQNPSTEISDIHLNNENVEYVIRDMVVAEKVSEVAAIESVRMFAVEQQQLMGNEKGIVMDGRDIGTTVFPNAELKFFMTADISIRVERRFIEMQQKNPHITLTEVSENLQMRDEIDSTRKISPLRMAEDAILLDNSHLTMEEQLQFALEKAEEKIMLL